MRAGNRRSSGPTNDTPPKGKPPINPPGVRGSSQKPPAKGENDTITNLMGEMSGNKGPQKNAAEIKIERAKLDRARRTFGMSKSVKIKGLDKVIPGQV